MYYCKQGSQLKIVLCTTVLVMFIIVFSNKLINREFNNNNNNMDPIIIDSNYKSKLLQTDENEFIEINWKNYMNKTVPIDFGNSTMIFNTIYAAMKQSASDIHPLGLTYFPAIIPKGTLLYHSTIKPGIPQSFEWLALDHEFSYSFGVRFPQYGRNNHSKLFDRGKPRYNHPTPPNGPHNTTVNHPGSKTYRDSGESYFLTFEVTRDLSKLIYLDGASAAKTDSGEMDTQKLLYDIISESMNGETKSMENEVHGDRLVMEERLYAERICQWGKPLGLDGYIRVEIGFEVVLCDFLNGSVELISNTTIPNFYEIMGIDAPADKDMEHDWPLDHEGTIIEDKLTEEQKALLDKEDRWQRVVNKFSSMKGFDWIRAGNIHDKGENRVILDYRYLVTSINRTVMNPNPNGRRLLNDNMNEDIKREIVNELTKVIKSHNFGGNGIIDWQLHIERVMDKFAPMIKIIQHILNNDTDEERGYDELALEVARYTFNFIHRFSTKNPEDPSALANSKHLAIYQYSKPIGTLSTSTDIFIWSAIVCVVKEIVDQIYLIHDELFPIVLNNLQTEQNGIKLTEDEKSQKISTARKQINKLVSQLYWIPLEYECETKCKFDEICYTPSWGPSPLSWNSAVPDKNNNRTTNNHPGIYYDPKVGRNVIRQSLQCINANFLIEGK